VSEQGGGAPSFRVNVWDVTSVLLNMITAVVGSIAGGFSALGYLAKGHAGYVDDARDFREQASLSIETIAGGK
jgi:hypothetical protein